MSATRPCWMPVLMLCLFVGACASTEEDVQKTERLSSKTLVELYDLADPGGMIEIELERDGTIIEMEADVAIDALPDAVRAAALGHLPGAMITGGEREMKRDGEAWEVKLVHDGTDWELVMTGDGQLLESERSIARSDAPDDVLSAANRAVPGGQLASVEIIERGSMTEYHVKKTVEGVSYKIVLAPDGTVKRAVREHRAEIEIPLH